MPCNTKSAISRKERELLLTGGVWQIFTEDVTFELRFDEWEDLNGERGKLKLNEQKYRGIKVTCFSVVIWL